MISSFEVRSVQMPLDVFQPGSVAGNLGSLIDVVQNFLRPVMSLSKLAELCLRKLRIPIFTLVYTIY